MQATRSLVVALLGWLSIADLAVFCQETPPPPAIPRPTWKTGDRWVVETVTRRLQARDAESPDEGVKLRWQFEVTGLEKIGGRDCFKLDVACLVGGRSRPHTTLWCDAQNLMPRQVATQLTSAGKTVTVVESYDSAGGMSPVLTPINALPLDLPAFVAAGSKGLDSYAFVSSAGPAGAKDIGSMRFSHPVQQRVGRPTAKSLEKSGLATPAGAKAIGDTPLVEVELETSQRKVTQWWQSGRPWPLVSDNGYSRARLVTEP